MFSVGSNLTSSYFGLQDEVNALAQTAAIAPFIQTANALATWKTSEVGPLSEKNLLKNNTVYLDDQGNMTDLSSLKLIPKDPLVDGETIYLNNLTGHLMRGSVDLEAVSGGNVIAPLSQTTTAIPTWGAANTLTNSTVLLDNSANITGVGTLELINKTGITDPNTLWINALDGHLYRGTEDVEAVAGDVTTTMPLGTANDGYVIVSSGTTGAYIKEAAIDTTGGDLAILTPAKKLKMYDNNSLSVLPILYTDGTSTVAGFGNCFNSPVSPNEAVIFGRDNDVSGKIETSVCIGNNNFGSLTSASGDNTVIGHYCLSSLVTGQTNIAIGYSVLPLLSSGEGNIFIGPAAGQQLTQGVNNIMIGEQTGLSIESYTTRIGYDNTTRVVVKGVHSQTPNNKAKIAGITSSGVLEDSGIFFDTSPGNLSLTQTNVIAQAVGVANTVNFGLNQLLVSTDASANTLFGNGQLTHTTTGCNSNNVFGTNSLIGCTSGVSNNVVYGSNCVIQFGASNISNNVILGNSSCQSLNGGVGNIVVGNSVGNAMTDNTNNILIGSQGVASEDNVVRVGTSGVHSTCFLQGVTATALSNRQTMGINTATGQLGYFPNQCTCVAELAFANYVTPYQRTTVALTPQELAFTGTSTTNDAGDFSFATPGRIVWLGANGMMFKGTFSMSCTLATGTNVNVDFFIAINGTPVPNSAFRRRLNSTVEWNVLSFSKMFTLNTGQYVSIFVTNVSGNETLNFGNINLNILEAMV